MKQSAVEWLINEIDMQYPDINIKWKEWMVDKAREMEMEQIEQAFNGGREERDYKSSLWDCKSGLDYYNETYNTEE
jgi:hypothetical protein